MGEMSDLYFGAKVGGALGRPIGFLLRYMILAMVHFGPFMIGWLVCGAVCTFAAKTGAAPLFALPLGAAAGFGAGRAVYLGFHRLLQAVRRPILRLVLVGLYAGPAIVSAGAVTYAVGLKLGSNPVWSTGGGVLAGALVAPFVWKSLGAPVIGKLTAPRL